MGYGQVQAGVYSVPVWRQAAREQGVHCLFVLFTLHDMFVRCQESRIIIDGGGSITIIFFGKREITVFVRAWVGKIFDDP